MNNKGVKLLAAVAVIALALVCVCVIPSDVDSAPTYSDGGKVASVSTAEDFVTAKNNDNVTDIILLNDMVFGANYGLSHNMTIDLNGHTITVNSNNTGAVVSVINGAVVTIKNGTIDNTACTVGENQYGAIYVYNDASESQAISKLTLDNVDIKSNQYGVVILSKGSVTIDDSDITAKICAISGNGNESGSEVIINSGTFTSEEYCAVYFPSTQKLDINGGTFNGKTGIDIRAGEVTIDNAIINVNQSGTVGETPIANNGPSSLGMGIAIIDSSAYASGSTISVTINNVTINGAIYDYYVGDKNLKDGANLIGAAQFNTEGLLQKTWTPNHDVELTIGALKITNGKTFGSNYRLAITSATDKSFSIPADSIFDGKIAYNDNGEKSAVFKVMAGASGITFTKGSIAISGNIVTGNGTVSDLTTKIGEASSTADLVFKDLTITKSGTNNNAITLDKNVTIKGIVTVDEGVTITTSGTGDSKKVLTVSENSTLNVKGNVQGTKIENNGIVSVASDSAKLPGIITGTGSVDTSAIQEDAQLGGTINSDTGAQTTFSSGQVVTLVSDTTLVNNTILTINGTLIVPEGITLTLKDKSVLIINGPTSKMINDGTIIVESEGQVIYNATTQEIRQNDEIALVLNGGVIENNGIIDLDWDNADDEWYGQRFTMYVASGTVKNAGTISVSEGNTLGIVKTSQTSTETTFDNLEDGTITSNGALIGYVNNAGLITIDGFAWGWISMVSQDAKVDVVSLTTNVGQDLVINDFGMKLSTDSKVNSTNANSITLSAYNNGANNAENNGYNTIGGISITASVRVDRTNATPAYYNELYITGNVDYTTKTENITDATTISGISITCAGDGVIIADKFSVPKQIGSFTVAANGVVKISGEASIECTITTAGSGATQGKIIVTGTLTTPNKLADTVKIEAAYYKIAKDLAANTPEKHIYTNLANAVAAAPKEITVTGDVVVDTEITIPAGTTVKINNNLTVTKDGFITVVNNAKLSTTGTATVNGVLSAENKKNLTGTYNSDVTTSDDTAIIYSGLAYALSVAESGQTVKVSSNAAATVTTVSDITIKEGVTLDMNGKNLTVDAGYVLTIDGTLFLNNSTLATNPATQDGLRDAGKVILNGMVKSVGEMNYNVGTKPLTGAYYVMLEKGALYNYVEPVSNAAPKASTFYNQTVYIKGEQNVGNIAFTGTADENITVYVESKVTGGSISVDYATVVIKNEFTGTVTDGNGKVVMSKVTGSTAENSELRIASTNVNDTKTFFVKGTVATIGNEGSMEISRASLNTATLKAVTIGDDVIVIGNSSATEAIVNGDLFVNNEKTFSVSGAMYVLGAIDTADKTDSKIEGKVTVSGCMYVGIAKDTGAAASVDGSVTVSSIMYVLAGSNVDPNIVADKKGVVEFYVDGKLYMTAYADNEGATLVGLPDYKLDDADVQGWFDENDNEITDESPMPDGKVTAKIDYYIYTVWIIADEGIGTIAVDGIVAVNYLGNVYQVSNLAAGVHKVTYTLKNGYGGEAKLYFDGKEVSNITLSGEESDTMVPEFTYNLQGATPAAPVSPGTSGSDDGMSITDILLIVLVVLIVIMAILVAIRMMRS